MKSVKRLFMILLCLCMVVLTAACAGGNHPGEEEKSSVSGDVSEESSEESQDVSGESSEEKVLNARELGAYLASTPFQQTGIQTKNTYGLLNTAVGVDRERFESTEVMYPFPEDSEFAYIVNLADKGFSESNTAEENASAVNKALFTLINKKGLKKIVIPDGTFKISKTISIAQDDIYITGGTDTTLVYTNWDGAFGVSSSKNVHISNLRITYETPPMLTGRILSYDSAKRQSVIQMDKGFDVTNPYYTQVRGYYEMKEESDGRYVIDMDKNLRYWYQDSFRVLDAEQRTIRVTYNQGTAHDVVPGTVVCLCLGVYQEDPCICLMWSEDFYLENVRADTLPGMGLVIMYSKNAYINRFIMTPDTSRNLHFSTAWDGMHTVGLSGDCKMTNCMIDGTEDDCVNICMDWVIVDSISGKVIQCHAQNEGLRGNLQSVVDVGDTVEIYSNIDFHPYGTYQVVEVTGTSMTLDREIESGVGKNYIIGVDSKATHLYIDNCIFKNSIGHAGLIQCRNSIIKNSYAGNLLMGGWRIHSAQYVYYEAILPRNLTVENCKMTRCGLGDVNFYAAIEVMAYIENLDTTQGILRQIYIRNNFFFDQYGGSVALFGVGEAEIENNFSYNVSLNDVNDDGYNRKMPFAGNTSISVHQSKDVSISDNYTYIENAHRSYVNIKVYTYNCTDVTTTNNKYTYG